MEEVKRYLEERKLEINMHLNLLEALETNSSLPPASASTLHIDVRQVRIIKASILVHLYNIVEATMAKLCDEIVDIAHTHHPKTYSDELFNSWVNTNMRTSNELNISNINQRAQTIGRELLANSEWSKLEIKKTDGNWDNQRIIAFTERFDIKIAYPKGFKSKVMKPYFDDMSMMQYVRQRRNDLAHGFITFEEGANKQSHKDLDNIAKLTIGFMELIVNGCHDFVAHNKFLKQTT